MIQLFIGPLVVSVLALFGVFLWGGFGAFLLAGTLSILEVTLSFDNAVVNAKVLKEMPLRWQKRFLTWGMLFSVLGTRLVLPIVIVSVVSFASPWVVGYLALYDPASYSALLRTAESSIKAFGGAFLLMVSLKFFFDVAKEVHWVAVLERRFAQWGRIDAVEVSIALLVLLLVSYYAHDPAVIILRAGMVGIVLFTFVEGIAHGLGSGLGNVARSGLSLFIYLNVLDAAFSLDGVIGAFALTTALPIIVAGLGIGAYFVRTLTVYLVKAKTLESLRYIEHGAHWAIFGLAASMFAGLVVHVPEAVSAMVGLLFIGLAYFSSRRSLRTQELV